LRTAVEIARLNSILGQLPLPKTVLELGCGDHAAPLLYYAARPSIMLVGVDHDPTTLYASHDPQIYLVRADIAHLPFNMRFDLVVARHPDIDRHAVSWQTVITNAPALLSKGGLLLITTYALPEIETVDRWIQSTSLTQFPMMVERLIPPGIQGRDRFIRCWRNY